jgi:hypothetical protein
MPHLRRRQTACCRDGPGSAFDLPFSGRRAAPGEAVVATRRLSGGDTIAHQVAFHSTRVKCLQYRGRAMAHRLRITLCIGASELARLSRIKPLHALEHQSVVLRRAVRRSKTRVWLPTNVVTGCHAPPLHLRYHHAKLAISPSLSVIAHSSSYEGPYIPENPMLTGRTAIGFSRVSRISSVSWRITRDSPSRSVYSTFSWPISTSSIWPR